MSLYTKKQLKIERNKGLQLTDEENKNWDKPGQETLWSNEQFEEWLSDKEWEEDVKDYHRTQFKGKIVFSNGGSSFYYI